MERLLGTQLDRGARQVTVDVLRLDAPSSRAIRGARDRADQRGVFDHGGDHHELALLHVSAHLDGQLRQALDALLLIHR